MLISPPEPTIAGKFRGLFVRTGTDVGLTPPDVPRGRATGAQIRAGADDLGGRLQRYGPRAVAHTSIGVYRWFRSTSKVG
jgi:hypothetical protein